MAAATAHRDSTLSFASMQYQPAPHVQNDCAAVSIRKAPRISAVTKNLHQDTKGESMTTAPTITTESYIAAREGVVSCDLDDEVVLLHLHSGTYFGLNPVGVDIWSRIQTGERVSEILEYLLTQYAVD